MLLSYLQATFIKTKYAHEINKYAYEINLEKVKNKRKNT